MRADDFLSADGFLDEEDQPSADGFLSADDFLGPEPKKPQRSVMAPEDIPNPEDPFFGEGPKKPKAKKPEWKLPDGVRRADAPYADRREALADAVSLIEEGANADEVFKNFGELGIPKSDIIAEGTKLRGKAFTPDTRTLTARDGVRDGQMKAATAEDFLSGPGGRALPASLQNFGKRVAARTRQSATGAMASLGLIGPSSTARMLAADQRRLEAAAPSEETQRQLENLGKVESMSEVPGAIINNPVGTALMLGESLVMSLPAMAGYVANLPRRGAAAFAGTTSGGMEFGASLSESLADRGVSLLDVEKVDRLLRDPEFMAEARERATKRGVTIGVIDALSAGFAGKFIEPALAAVRNGKLTGKAARNAVAQAWGKELALQTAGGAGGEAAAQGLTGEYKPLDIAMEGLVGGITAPVEALGNARDLSNARVENQFARAFEADVEGKFFEPGAVDGYVRASLQPGSVLTDPNAVRPEDTRRPIRVEDQPTTVMTPEEIRARRMAAAASNVVQEPSEEAPPAVAPASPAPANAPPAGQTAPAAGPPQVQATTPAAQPPKAPAAPAVGVATVPQGNLAERSKQAAQENRDAGVVPVATPVASAPAAPRKTPGPGVVESSRKKYAEQKRTLIRKAQEQEVVARNLAAAGLADQAAAASARGAAMRKSAAQLPSIEAPVDGPELQQFERLSAAFEQAFGAKPVAYSDSSRAAADGFFDDEVGVPFINVSAPEVPVVRTIFHEFKHQMRLQAQQGNAGAQRAEQMLDRVWDMISPEGKKAYAEKYLFKAQGATVEQVLADPNKTAVLKEEMLADFMGKRGTDKAFMRKLAKREPEAFGDFVREWIRVLDQMLQSLMGTGGAAEKDVDQFLSVRKLREAKKIAEDVLVEWAKANPQQAKAAGVDQDAARFESEGGRFNSARREPSELGAFNPFLNDFKDDEDLGLPPIDESKLDQEDATGRTPAQAIYFIAKTMEMTEDKVRSTWGYSDPNDYIALADKLVDAREEMTGGQTPAPDRDIPTGETPALSEAEMQAVMDELAEEQQQAGVAVAVEPEVVADVPAVDFTAVPDKKIKAAGVMAETAFPDLAFAPSPYSSTMDAARVVVGGRPYNISYRRGELETQTRVPSDIVRDARLGDRTPGQMIGSLNLSMDGAKQWSKRFIASADLFRRRFDLFTSVPGDSRKRVVDAWKKVSSLPKAFEFGKDVKPRGKDNSEIAQSIADQMLAGTKWRAETKRKNFFGDDGLEHDDSVAVRIYKGEVFQGEATIEYRRSRGGGKPPVAVMHTTGFSAGSGAGKPFYQVAFALADARDATVEADPIGLLAINAYRRTEQQASAALRSGKTKNVQPGFGQRIYGWNDRTTTQDQQDRNMARLMMAAARNAAEFFPGVRDLNYDLKANKFTFSDGSSAETTVELALLDPDLRQVSISRSTLARAAITFAAIDGRLDLDGVNEVASPVLYSARAPQADEPAAATETPETIEAAPTSSRPTRNMASGGRIRATIADMVQMAESQSSWRGWFDRHEEQLREMFGEDADLFKQFLSATSQAATVPSNVSLALTAYRQFYANEPFTGFLPSVIQNLQRIRYRLDLRGPKISQYGKALGGNANGVAVDRHIAQLMFNTSRPNQRQINAAHRRIAEIADRLQWEPRQVQSALWAFNQVRKGKDPAEVQSYDTLLKQRAAIVAEVRRLAEESKRAGGGLREPSLLAGRRDGPADVRDRARTRDEPSSGVQLEFSKGEADLTEDPGSISFSGRQPTYASRPVSNASDILAWARSQGFKSALPAEELHVTVAFSREPMDASEVPAAEQSMVSAGGKRTVEPLGDEGAIVLKFESAPLQQRWKQYRDAGASWDYDSYQPHITITYDGEGVDLSKVKPYTGAIVLGPETTEPLNTDAATELREIEEPIRASGRQMGGRYTLEDFGLGAKTIEKFQDRYNRWKQAINAVRKQGGTVTEDNDFYLAEERYWGKVGAQLEDFKAEVEEFVASLDPGPNAIVNGVRQTKLSLAEVALYAYAEHAKDRNDYIATIRANMPDGGSGMTNDDAQAILDAAQQAGVSAQLQRATAKLREWVQGTRDILLAEGLITIDEYNSWTLGMQSYVPLRGLPPDSILLQNQRPGTGQGFDIKGLEYKKMAGRRSEAKQIIEHIIMDRTRAHIRAGKNEVLRTFLKFVLDNPSPNLWQVNAVERRAVAKVDANGDHIVEEQDRVIADDRTVTVKDGGEEIHILILDPTLREQMKNLNSESVGKFLGGLLMVNRLLSRLYTSLSPTFTVINFARDVVTAGFGAIDEIGFVGAARLYAQLPKSIYESYAAEAGSMSSDYQDFRMIGGKTGFFDFKMVDDLSRDLSESAQMAERGLLDPRKLGPKTLAFIESMNAGLENSVRLAAYKAALQSGKTKVQAGSIAKNITVNFNRKGTSTPGMSAWFLFFNPAVQGTTRMLQALANPKVLSTLGVAMTGMFGLAMRNAGMGEDEDGVSWWDKIPNEVKERNIIIIHPPGSKEGEGVPGSLIGRYTKVPMPYGYNFFAVLANQTADVIRNGQDPRKGREPWEAFLNVFGAFMGSWVPVAEVGGSFENEKTAALVFTPDAFNPIIQGVLNVNPFGRALSPESPQTDGLPDSTKKFAGQTGTLFDKAAETMNRAAGGTAINPPPGVLSLFDLTPGQVENLVRGYLGGPATFTMDIANAVYARQSLKRDEVDLTKLPFYKQLQGVIDDETDRMMAYSRMEKASKLVKRAKAGEQPGNEDDLEALLAEDEPIIALGRNIQSVRRQLSQLRKDELSVITDEQMSDSQKLAEMTKINAYRRKALQDFNRAYDEALLQQRAQRESAGTR
jgi:hypothetical protein